MIRATLIAATVFHASAAAGQEPVDLRQENRQGDLDAPLEEGVADVSALGTSMRLIDPGLVAPMDFGEVYRVPGMPALLMRIAGGVYAVFPQSVYSAEGAQIPPGTIFYIGAPPAAPSEASPEPVAPDASLASGHHGSLSPLLNLDGGWTTGGETPSIANDAMYRSQRLRELMQVAAEHADRAGASPVQPASSE
jgi:hypothetical protein